MPVCTRVGLDKKAEPVENFQDSEKVFYCELTKEIFRNYEDYFQRVMLLNSTIWSCAETGRQNLTYAEALKSERKTRKTGENLGEWLKAPALMLVEMQKQTSFRVLLAKVFAFIKDRLFKGEEIFVTKTKHNYVPCKVVQIITPKEAPVDGVFDPKTVKYKVQKLRNASDTWITTTAQARRKRNLMNMETLKIFMREHTVIGENSICVKPESYKKYVTSKNVTFDSFYVGNMPKWEPGKKFAKGLIQASMGNYVIHDAANKQRELENLKEAMERMRREKEERQAEQERKRSELMSKIEEAIVNVLRKCDDLERKDQKVIPPFKPVKTIVAMKHFSEFLMIQEFLHSFTCVLSASDVFRKNITFQQMCRAFLIREVAGPLSDILQVLISTIFALQIEENNDCPIRYMKTKKEGFLWKMANSAIDAHFHVKTYYALDMYELPIDAQTLTEILRLHLLSSGAPNDERSEAYRYQYRNGYSVTEDPGLLLRIQYPHILRALKMYTIYQLPFKDILKVLNCLMEQILTYNAAIAFLEERQENLSKVRHNIRMLLARENKRLQQMLITKKTLSGEVQLQMMEHKDDSEKKMELERWMNRRLKEQEEQDARDRGNFEYELNQLNAKMFDYLTLLGTDRAYRNYYVFESLPGLFIEHPTEKEIIPCLEDPPKNDNEIVVVPKEKHKLRTFFLNRHKQNDKENMNKPSEATSCSLSINGESMKLNGSSHSPEKGSTHTNELYMCSGDKKNCVVHDPRHPSRIMWSYIDTKEDLDSLIESLNPLGIRECALKETLIKIKHNLIPHMEKCSTQILSVDMINREQSVNQMLTETQKRYANSNFGFPANADINEVMHSTLTQQVLEFERDISDGNLGRMKVSDLERWRLDLSCNSYSSQCKQLKFGPEHVNGNERDAFLDPGTCLGDTVDVESEDSGDENISTLDSPSIRRNVSNLASALLQIEQCIEKKFLKEPFGIKTELKDRCEMEAKMAACRAKLEQWELSLMNSTSYSQIFLHINILSDAVKWNKSSMKSSCLICRRRGDADKLLLCDECNAGTHMFCMKPKLKKVPEGNWYCFRCEIKLGVNKSEEKQQLKAKKVFSMEEEEEYKGKKESDEDSIKIDGQHSTEIKKQIFGKKTGRHMLSRSDEEENERTSDDEPLNNYKMHTGRKNKQISLQKNLLKQANHSECDNNSANSDNEPLRSSSSFYKRNKKQLRKNKGVAGKVLAEIENDEKNSSTSDEEDSRPLVVRNELQEISKALNTGDTIKPRQNCTIMECSDEDENKRPILKNGSKREEKATIKRNECIEEVYAGNMSNGKGDIDEETCKCCNSQNADLSCHACKDCYHLECIGIRRVPRGNWLCLRCKRQEEKKRKLVDSESESSNDVSSNQSYFGNKKKRSRRNNQKGSLSASNDELSKNNNTFRRMRRTDESLKLDTIALYGLLDQIMKHEDAWPFLRPVSQSEVPDYHMIIKNPMDFARIKSNLNMCRYSTNEEVIRDIQLVFSNCDTYNSQGNDIYRAGASLECFVARKCQELNLKFTPSDMIDKAECKKN